MIKNPNVVLNILLVSELSFLQVNLQSNPAPTGKLCQCATLLLLKKLYTLSSQFLYYESSFCQV